MSVGDGFRIVAELVAVPSESLDASRWVSFLDPEATGASLNVRTRCQGDRFQPFGMSEPKRLQDFFVDEHVPRQWRDRVPLVVCDLGIAWVAGYRPAEWTRVPAGARQALRLELVGPA
jgi:tRNA(Ile)-lysidine synthase